MNKTKRKPGVQNQSKAPLTSLLAASVSTNVADTLRQLELSQWLEFVVGLCLFLVRNGQHLVGVMAWRGTVLLFLAQCRICRQAPAELALEQLRTARCSLPESSPKSSPLGKNPNQKT